jgi:hypothetical protein
MEEHMRHHHPGGRWAAEEAGEQGEGRGRHGGFGPRGPRPRGRSYGHESAPPSADGLAGWLAGRLPTDWFTTQPEVTVDRDEVTVVGELDAPSGEGLDDTGRAEAEAGRIRRFREQTREQRVAIAREIEARYGRAVAWGAASGGTRELFTNASVPVMTRLRQPERLVLDTLVDAGVARSRSDALAWCVRLVGRNTQSWLSELRGALESVERVRATGPDADPGDPATA